VAKKAVYTKERRIAFAREMRKVEGKAANLLLQYTYEPFKSERA